MLKTIFAAAGILLASLGVAQASTLEQIKNATYELYADGQPICSGTFVKPNEFLTASHCILDNVNKYQIYFVQDNAPKYFDLTVNDVNKDYDTATLKLTDPEAAFPFVDVATSYVPKAGDELVLSSYPEVMGYDYLTFGKMTGEVKTPAGLRGNYSYIADIETAEGSSGGGLYANIAGTWRLIGTTEGGPPAHDYMSFFSTVTGVNLVL